VKLGPRRDQWSPGNLTEVLMADEGKRPFEGQQKSEHSPLKQWWKGEYLMLK